MTDKYCPFCDALIKENEEETPSNICWNCKREINPEGLEDISPEEIEANEYKESFIVLLIRFIAFMSIVIAVLFFIFNICFSSGDASKGIGILIGWIIVAVLQLGFADIISLLNKIYWKMSKE